MRLATLDRILTSLLISLVGLSIAYFALTVAELRMALGSAAALNPIL